MRRLLVFCGSILFLLWIGCAAFPVRAVQVTPSGVTLVWDPSPDPAAVGYSLYYGPASGNYTNRLDVGGSTNAVISGLPPGATTFFVATAYDTAGRESEPSNEVIYTAPGILQVSVGADNRLHVTFPANSGHWYDVQSSANLVSWTTISSVFAETTGWLDVIDTTWTGTFSRFYRIVLH